MKGYAALPMDRRVGVFMAKGKVATHWRVRNSVD